MQTTERATRVAMGRIDAMRPDNQLIIKPTRAVRLTSQIHAVLAALRRKKIYIRDAVARITGSVSKCRRGAMRCDVRVY